MYEINLILIIDLWIVIRLRLFDIGTSTRLNICMDRLFSCLLLFDFFELYDFINGVNVILT